MQTKTVFVRFIYLTFLLLLCFTGCPTDTDSPQKGKPSITVEFTSITDEQINITANTQNDLSRKNADTLEIQVSGTLQVLWFVDGAQLNAAGTSTTRAAGDYPVGVHYVTAMVYRNGIPYSNELTFRVVE
jgi:hypothetical protein